MTAPPCQVRIIIMDEPAGAVLEPIILNPAATTAESGKSKISLRKTLGLMAAGWLVGNLIAGATLSLVLIFLVGSTGLVNVPFLTEHLFARAALAQTDTASFESANKKLDDIASLSVNQVLPQLTITDAEISALLNDAFNKTETTLVNPHLKISQGNFVFRGNIKETGAPIQVEGALTTSRGVLHLDIAKTIFGKLALPPQLMDSYLNSALAKVGLSLNSTAIPARKISVGDGEVTLQDVSKAD